MTLAAKVVEILGSVKSPELAADLVLRLAREAHFEEFEAERQRDMARTRKRKQRDISVTSPGQDRDKSVTSAGQERDLAVTVPPAPPSGSLSDPISGSPDLSEPDPEDPHSDERPGPLTRYSSNFVEFWLIYPRKVGKEAAWRVWKRLVPALPEVMRALNWQRASKQWRDGFIPNPATYLNQKRWLDEAGQPRDIAVTSAGPASPLDAYCDWHRDATHDQQPSRKPKDTCPSCKHLRAKGSGRPGGLSPIDDLEDPLPEWAGGSGR